VAADLAGLTGIGQTGGKRVLATRPDGGGRVVARMETAGYVWGKRYCVFSDDR